MRTIDEILATGWYTDRRGRDWGRIPGAAYWGRKVTQYLFAPNSETWSDEDMRLLIERDMHRDECAGLHDCYVHPTPRILFHEGLWSVVAPGLQAWKDTRHIDFADAWDAARALEVNP